MTRKKNRNNNNKVATAVSPNCGTDVKDELSSVFDTYQKVDDHTGETDPQYIGGEGIMKLCEDLSIDPEDVLVLIIMYKLGTKEQYKISRSEFCDGFRKYGIYNFDTMQKQVTTHWKKQTLNNPNEFKELYNFSFEYSRDPTQKGMSPDIAVATWKVLFEGRWKFLAQWNDFIEKKYKKAIQKDLWALFYDFTSTVGDDLKKYSEEQAWPLAIDEFVEILQSK
jgi:hypothetical protein